MPKHKYSNPYAVDVAFDVTASQSVPATITIVYKTGPDLVATVQTVHRRRIRSALVTSPLVRGWRAPKPYKSAAALRVGFPYQLRNVGTTIQVSDSGTARTITGLSHGVGHADSIFFQNDGTPNGTLNVENRSMTTALNKLKSDKVNLAESLSGLKSDVSYIASLFSSLAKLVLAARRGPAALAVALRKEFGSNYNRTLKRKDPTLLAANLWLQYKYGIYQSMVDVSNAFNEFQTDLAKEDQRIHVESTAEESANPILIDNTVKWWERKGQSVAGAKTVLYYKISSPWINTYSKYNINPLDLAWEALGWSFLVDWLLPVSSFLSALDADVGMDFLAGTTTTWRAADYTFSWMEKDGPALAGGPFWVGDPLKNTYKCFATYRKVLAGPPRPGLYIKSPFSSVHLANALALSRALRG